MRLLGATGVSRVFELGNYRRPLIVVYHQLHDPQVLQSQLRYLMTHYNIVDLETIAAAHAFGGHSLPRRAAAITLDDGYRSAYAVAFPVLLRMSCPATVFANTSSIDSGLPIWPVYVRELVFSSRLPEIVVCMRRERHSLRTDTHDARLSTYLFLMRMLTRQWQSELANALSMLAEAAGHPELEFDSNELPLTWTQVDEMSRSGLIAFGNHSHSHRVLTHVDGATLAAEIHRGKERLRDHGVRPSRVFCYPNGAHDDRVIRELIAAGYFAAVTTRQRRVAPGSDAMLLERIGASDLEDESVFRVRMSGAFDGLRPLQHVFHSVYEPLGRRLLARSR